MRSPGEALCTLSNRQHEVEAGRKEIEGKIASRPIASSMAGRSYRPTREILARPADLSPRRREFSLDPKTFGFYG
jgi:hypothetical protein